jgi:putative spermidine/putrescine transport system ATP-binding protein
MSYIELKNIQKSFGEKEILKGITLSIEKDEFVTFLGPSGCGKTTLLRCLVGLESIDGGDIFLDGVPITETPANQRGISMIFQQYNLFPTMNVYHNVSFGLRMKSLPKKDIHKRVHEVLEMVDMIGHEKKYPYQLSGGEQQRVALARCLIMNPKVLLLDEPFSAIDAKLRKELQIYIKQIHKDLGMTSIFVTHDQEEAMRISDTIHLFNQGVLEQSGVPGEVYAHPQTPFVAGFIGSYNQISMEDFEKIMGTNGRSKHMAAIRPEVIQMSSTVFENNDAFYDAKGRIMSLIPQGNVIRYAVSLDTVTVNVDLIFHSDMEWSVGQEIFLRIQKEHVLLF